MVRPRLLHGAVERKDSDDQNGRYNLQNRKQGEMVAEHIHFVRSVRLFL